MSKHQYRVHVRTVDGKHDIHFVDARGPQEAREIAEADHEVERVTKVEGGPAKR